MTTTAEATALHAEILEYSRRITVIAKFSILGTVAFRGYSVTMERPGYGWLVALLPLCIAASLAELSLSFKLQIMRIASYFRHDYRDEQPYEHRLRRFRAKITLPYRSFELDSLGTLPAMGLASLLFSVDSEPTNWTLGRVLLTVPVVLAYDLFIRRVLRLGSKSRMGSNQDAQMLETWQSIPQPGRRAHRRGGTVIVGSWGSTVLCTT